MAKQKYISDFERTVIQIGKEKGIPVADIARFTGRARCTIYKHMETDVPMPLGFVVEEIAAAMRGQTDGKK